MIFTISHNNSGPIGFAHHLSPSYYQWNDGERVSFVTELKVTNMGTGHALFVHDPLGTCKGLVDIQCTGLVGERHFLTEIKATVSAQRSGSPQSSHEAIRQFVLDRINTVFVDWSEVTSAQENGLNLESYFLGEMQKGKTFIFTGHWDGCLHQAKECDGRIVLERLRKEMFVV